MFSGDYSINTLYSSIKSPLVMTLILDYPNSLERYLIGEIRGSSNNSKDLKTNYVDCWEKS